MKETFKDVHENKPILKEFGAVLTEYHQHQQEIIKKLTSLINERLNFYSIIEKYKEINNIKGY